MPDCSVASLTRVVSVLLPIFLSENCFCVNLAAVCSVLSYLGDDANVFRFSWVRCLKNADAGVRAGFGEVSVSVRLFRGYFCS